MRGVEVAQITDVELAAELPSSTDDCRELCDGRGRDTGQARCDGASDRGACLVPIATAVAQQCMSACLEHATGIAGRGWLDGSTIAAANGPELQSGNLGDLRAHIVFDQMIDANRRLVE